MEQNRKLTEVPLAQVLPEGSALLGVVGGSLKRVPPSLVGGGAAQGGGEPYVKATAPAEGSNDYVVDDARLSLADGAGFYVLFPDERAPTREQVKLLVNGTRCTLYWKGENLSLMATTLGHVLTRSYGYVHLTCRAGGGLELQGVDTIASGTRLYLSPSEWQEQTWVEA